MPTATIDGLDIFWRETGNGPPVVFLMGMETDHRGWFRVIHDFKGSFRCISIDNRDVGQSGLASQNYTVADMARDTIGVLDHLGLGSVSVIGQSMGGMIAQELAWRVPDRIDRMILISSCSKLNSRARETAASWKPMKAKLTLREYYSAVFPWLYTPVEYATPFFIENILDRATVTANPQPHEAFCRHVDAVTGFDSSSWLDQISTRTLVVGGEEDLFVPAADTRALASAIPGSGSPLIIPGAGHGLVVTDAIASALSTMAAFLDAPAAG